MSAGIDWLIESDPRLEPPRRYLVRGNDGKVFVIHADDAAEAARRVAADAPSGIALLGTHESVRHGAKRLGWTVLP